MEDINSKIKTDIASDKKLYESRFKTLLRLLRLGGIYINMKSIPILNSVYNITINVCYYTTVSCHCMDTFVHRHQLVEVMKKIRVLVAMQMCMWLHLSIRYAALKSSFSYQFDKM
jgi:hypothetical protein